jgi:hypothetical protein
LAVEGLKCLYAIALDEMVVGWQARPTRAVIILVAILLDLMIDLIIEGPAKLN